MTDGAGASIGAGRVANAAGAMMSLALMIGVAVWGYKLFVRDVSGIPVVRAVDGPMRQAPDNPGGTIASHQGLAVNEIAAVGVASGPQDALRLAPGAVDLTGEDLPGEELAPVAQTAEAPEPSDGPAIGLTAPMIVEAYGLEDSPGAVEADADIEMAASQPVRPEPEIDPIQAVLEAVVLDAPSSMIIPASVPGVVRSERPRMRPAGARMRPAPVETPVLATAIDAAAISVGAHLIQLGAYDSDAVAQSEWARLSGRFSDYLSGRSPVVQEAERAGRTFYRLRVAGFEDMSDARRLCSALKAAGTDCIPVVAR